MMAWTHDGLQRDLAEHLRTGPGLIVWENMQMGPVHSPRPDCYAIPRSYSKFRPISYEIKVSIADFRRDVTSGKWQEYLQFSCGIIFAAPAGLIDKKDVPAGCGLIVRHENCWRNAKGPTLRVMEDMPLEAWAKLIIDGIERESKRQQVSTRSSLVGCYSVESAIRKTKGDEIGKLVGQAIQAKDLLQYAIEQDEAKRREINEGTERYAKMHRELLERDLLTLNHEQQRLAQSLGLPADSDIHVLTSAIRAARERLGRDAEINRLRGLFDRLKLTLEQAAEPLPGAEVPPA
jgi:hypothetical protein